MDISNLNAVPGVRKPELERGLVDHVKWRSKKVFDDGTEKIILPWAFQEQFPFKDEVRNGKQQ